MIKKVAFLGLGVMGYPMAGWLSRNDFDVTVYNRTTAVAQRWCSQYSGQMARTPEAAVLEADAVFLCVGNDQDVQDVALGPKGILNGLRPGAVLVDHTTTSAELAKQLAVAFEARGCRFIDAPVSGGQQLSLIHI